MALETGSYVADLVITNPTATDAKSAGDDHLRLIKTALRNSFAGFSGAIIVSGTDGGSANTYTLTPTTALGAYGTNMLAVFTPAADNTGAATLNISGLGAKDIKSVSGAALIAGDLVAGNIYFAAYNGINFRLVAATKNYIDQLAFNSALPALPNDGNEHVTKELSGAVSWSRLKTIGGTSLFGTGNIDVVPDMPLSSRTSNTIIGVADRSSLINVTSGTFTQTFEACATLGNEWYCWYKNSGTGDITLDPNSTEQIDGLTSYIMYSGEVRLIQCDGSAFTTVVLNPFYRAFTATDTFVKPPGYMAFSGLAWPGGASGERTDNVVIASRGGCGASVFSFELLASLLSPTETVTIGAGGAAVTGVAVGNSGGTTSIGTVLSITGATATDNGGVINGLGAVSISASPWVGGTSQANNVGLPSGYGGGGGGSIDSANPGTARNGGASAFGGAGGASSSSGNGVAGTAPGGGGGATKTGTQSGAGARGEVRIWGVC